MCTICLIFCCLILCYGCHSTNNQIIASDKKRYLKALKILFQEGAPFNKEVLAEMEYQKYLQEITANPPKLK